MKALITGVALTIYKNKFKNEYGNDKSISFKVSYFQSKDLLLFFTYHEELCKTQTFITKKIVFIIYLIFYSKTIKYKNI